jgi:hypothetical protein
VPPSLHLAGCSALHCRRENHVAPDLARHKRSAVSAEWATLPDTAAAINEFKFTPRMPRNDGEFKRAYVAAAAAAAAGLSKDQVVRIYGVPGCRAAACIL